MESGNSFSRKAAARCKRIRACCGEKRLFCFQSARMRPPGRSSTTGERRARATYRPRLGQQQRRWHSPTAPAYTLVCIRAVDVRRGARWGDLLTQFVENMTQPRDSLPLITYTSLRLCRCPSRPSASLPLSLSLYSSSSRTTAIDISTSLADPVLTSTRVPSSSPVCVRLSFAYSLRALAPRLSAFSVLPREKPQRLFLSFFR